MNETTKAFSDAFSKYIDAKLRLIHENVPHYIQVNPKHFNLLLETIREETGEVSHTWSYDGERFVYFEFLNEQYEVPLYFNDKVETYEMIYKD